MTASQMRGCILLLMLAVCSVQDIRRQQVFVPVPAAGIFLGICLTAVCRDVSWLSVLGGIAAGAAMIAFGFLSRGAVGSGDGWVTAACGGLLGITQSMALLLTASLTAMAAAAGLLLTKRKRKHDTIPFVPFLLAAFVLQLMTGGL